jgi:hypothetical protein
MLLGVYSQLIFIVMHLIIGNYIMPFFHFGLFVYFDMDRRKTLKIRVLQTAKLKKLELLIMKDYLKGVATMEDFNTDISTPIIMGVIQGYLYRTKDRSKDGKWLSKELKKIHKESYETSEGKMTVIFEDPADELRFLTLIKHYLKEFENDN